MKRFRINKTEVKQIYLDAADEFEALILAKEYDPEKWNYFQPTEYNVGEA